jgi:hypothetical protein
MPKRKTEFWWASIHGADPEPVEKAEHEGRPCVYTLGCADPFYLDEPGIEFVSWFDSGIDLIHHPTPMKRPLIKDKALAALAAKRAKIARSNASHGWRGPR